ncbi:hypothetical protein [Halostagnicola bangensis]
MNRRQYLSTVGSLAVVSSLAGCLGGIMDSEEGEPLPDDHRADERSINRAVGNLNKAAVSIDGAESGLENPDDVDFSLSEPRSFIDTARTELEAVDNSDIGDELRNYSTVLEGMVDVLETLTDETLEEDIETVSAEMDGGDTASATETLETRSEETDDARTSHDEAMDILGALDRDSLEDHSIVEVDRVESGAETLGEVLGSFESLISGYESMLSGHEGLDEGEERFDAGEYERAESAFENAASSFGDAAETFSDGESDAPDSLEGYFDTATCQSGHLETAATEFEEGASAADGGDVLATQRHQSNGEDALEKAENC